MICHECNENILTQSPISRFAKIVNRFSGHITWVGPTFDEKERKLLPLRAGTLLSERGWATRRWRLHVLYFGDYYWKLFLWKILSEFDWANVVCLIFAFCLILRGHEACLSISRTLISCCFSSWQDLTSADAVLAFPFTSLKRCEPFLCGYITF